MNMTTISPQTNGQISRPQISFTPHVDVLESSDEVIVFANVPGVKADDVDIRYQDGELALAGIVHPRNENVKWLVREYEVGNFYRTFQLSDQIDVEKISAAMRDGELRIRLPKLEKAKPQKIAVTVV